MKTGGRDFSTHVESKIEASDYWYTSEQFKWANLPYIKNIYGGRFQFIKKAILKYSLNKQTELLDLGCGDGYWLKRIEDLRIESLSLKGVDYNHLRIERARKLLSDNTKLFVDEASTLDIDKQDIVLCMHVIEHIPDDSIFLKNILNIISPEGILILGTPNEGNYFMQRRNRKLHIFDNTDHIHFYVEGLIKARISKAGFDIIETYYDPFYFWNDKLFYNILKSKFGLNVLLKLSKFWPYFASGYIFICKPQNKSI